MWPTTQNKEIDRKIAIAFVAWVLLSVCVLVGSGASIFGVITTVIFLLGASVYVWSVLIYACRDILQQEHRVRLSTQKTIEALSSDHRNDQLFRIAKAYNKWHVRFFVGTNLLLLIFALVVKSPW